MEENLKVKPEPIGLIAWFEEELGAFITLGRVPNGTRAENVDPTTDKLFQRSSKKGVLKVGWALHHAEALLERGILRPHHLASSASRNNRDLTEKSWG